ncbi:MAG: c-type cytochrome [Pseudomonadota bacterium]
MTLRPPGALPLCIVLLGVTQPAFAQPPADFAICAACHATQPGKSSFGPNLRSVMGRKAATLPGYAYSDALKASGVTWNARTLDTWLTGPQAMVKGTRMPFAGLPDPVRRQRLIAYLATLQ